MGSYWVSVTDMAKSLLRILLKESVDQILGFIGNLYSGWVLERLFDDLTEHGVLVLAVEWRNTNQHFIDEDSE